MTAWKFVIPILNLHQLPWNIDFTSIYGKNSSAKPLVFFFIANMASVRSFSYSQDNGIFVQDHSIFYIPLFLLQVLYLPIRLAQARLILQDRMCLRA